MYRILKLWTILLIVVSCAEIEAQTVGKLSQANAVEVIKARIIPPCEILNAHDTFFRDSILIDHVVNKKIDKKTELKFISDRKELIPFEKVVSNDSICELWDVIYSPKIKIRGSVKQTVSVKR